MVTAPCVGTCGSAKEYHERLIIAILPDKKIKYLTSNYYGYIFVI